MPTRSENPIPATSPDARWPWVPLTLLLVALMVGALTVDRRTWPSFMGDEATYAMQAESLAFDGDLRYTAADYHRLVEHWGRPPQGLILQSGDGGATITYGKPVFYPLYLAPFVRLSPTRGPFVANALLLALASLSAAGVLRRRLGPWAPAWVAALVFGSVSFAFVFWIHADLFLMCLTALALALADGAGGNAQPTDDEPPRRSRVFSPRWPLVGILLAMVAFSRPTYLPLFLAVLAFLPRSRPDRWRSLALLLGSALAVVALTATLHWSLTRSWTGYGALRSGFYAHTGYPEVDFPTADWVAQLEEMGNAAARSPASVLRDKPLDASLLAWNSFYFLAGRHVGLVPYFLPVLLALWGPWRDRRRWALVAAVALSVGLFLWTRPFNFYGGGGTLANRYFLPTYPALWFLAGHRLRPAWIVASGFAAGLFLYPLWLAPRTFPIGEQGTYRYVSPLATQLLPFETTLSHLKLAGRDDLYDGGFYLRLISPELRAGGDAHLRLPVGTSGELLVGRVESLDRLELTLRWPDDVRVEVGGARVEALGYGPEGRRFLLHLARPDARHPMWWTWDPVSLHKLRIRFEGGPDRRVVFDLHLPGTPAVTGRSPTTP